MSKNEIEAESNKQYCYQPVTVSEDEVEKISHASLPLSVIEANSPKLKAYNDYRIKKENLSMFRSAILVPLATMCNGSSTTLN